jgi:hypothetical protein
MLEQCSGRAPASRYMWPHATGLPGLLVAAQGCPQRSKAGDCPSGSAASSVRLPGQAEGLAG